MDNVASLEGTGQPGGRHLEGPQSPQLTIEKVAPREVQVGKPATFRITVRNTGQAVAGNVEVRDQIPRGTRLLDSAPRAARGPRGELVWTLGTIKPGEQSSVEMQLHADRRGRDRQRGHGPFRRRRLGAGPSPPSRSWSSRPPAPAASWSATR